MTENELIVQLEELLGSTMGFPIAAMAKELTQRKVQLKPYLLWLLRRKGQNGFRKNLVRGIGEYAQESLREIQSLPQHIINAGNILERLTENEIISDTAMEILDRMSFPHAIYFLFAGVGLPLDKYRQAAKDYAEMFPDAVKSLPEPYKKLAEALTHDST